MITATERAQQERAQRGAELRYEAALRQVKAIPKKLEGLETRMADLATSIATLNGICDLAVTLPPNLAVAVGYGAAGMTMQSVQSPDARGVIRDIASKIVTDLARQREALGGQLHVLRKCLADAEATITELAG